LLFLSDLLLDSLFGVTPSILAAFSDISGGGDGIPWSSTTDWRRELDLPDVLGRRSVTDLDLDNGFEAPNMLVRPRDKGGLSTFSDDDPFEESFSSFSEGFFDDDFERFKSESFDLLSSFTGCGDSSERRSLEDFFSSFFGAGAAAAPHAPQEEDPSRTTRGRSFFDEDLDSLDSLGSGGGVGGPAGTTFSFFFSGSFSLLNDLLLLDFLSGITIESTVSSSSAGKLPGTSFDEETFFVHALFSSAVSLSFLELDLRFVMVCDLERLDFFLSSLSGAGGGGGGGDGGGGGATFSTSFSLADSNAFSLSAILPPTGFFVTTDAFIEVDADADCKEVVVALELAPSGSFALSAAISPLDASFLAASEPLLDFLVTPQIAKGSTFSLTGLRSMRGSSSGSASGSGSGSGSLVT
jgi:hypothetical protein